MIKKLKLKKGTFKHIESELYTYMETKREIEEIKSNIVHATPISFQENSIRSRGNEPSDPTGRTATLLMTHKKLEQLERITNTIDKVYNLLTEDKKKLVKLRYWSKPQLKTWEGIANEINISRRQALNWRNEIVFAIGELLGWS